MKLASGSGRLIMVQRLHAALIFVFPTVALGTAAWQCFTGRVEIWMPVLAVSGYVVTMLGITVGYHRLLAHRAFVTSPSCFAILTILGSMAAQGAPVYWVSNHRRHHRYADAAGDPHSPHHDGNRALHGWEGFLHAHLHWMFTHQLTSSVEYSRDLLQNKLLNVINRQYGLWVALGLLIPTGLGYLLAGNMSGVFDGLVWGGGVRLFISFHLTSSINSVTHLFGYRSYATDEHSRNNLWLGVPTLGEAWHNNHHAFPTSARFGLRWWELDIGWVFIRGLELIGVASGVRKPSPLSSGTTTATSEQTGQ